MSVYFGGSRSSINVTTALSPIIGAVVASGQKIHVGCQFGADQMVLFYAPASSLVVFAVAPHLGVAPVHVQQAARSGARVVLAAGGRSAPIPARYLLRSIAAFQGCSQAVFFSPGSGSLAVARECVRSGLPVFAFGEQPAQIPSCTGEWVCASYLGLACWCWLPTQQSMF